MTSVVAGPDFICIGMQKAGTGWLFDQLDTDRNFWMPPSKELHYLDNALKRPRTLLDNMHRRGNKDLDVYNEERRQRARRPLNERDMTFLDRALKLRGKPIDLAAYASLFDPKHELLSGDITPSYSTLSEDVIEILAERFPNLKIILLVRDPVERSWSLLNMKMRRGSVAEDDADNWAAISAKIKSPAFEARSYATQVWKRWIKHFPADRIKFFFFDDIAKAPAETRDAIVSFLSPAAGRSVGALAPEFNRKAVHPKAKMTSEVLEELVAVYTDELWAAAALFRGPAETWPGRYGLSR